MRQQTKGMIFSIRIAVICFLPSVKAPHKKRTKSPMKTYFLSSSLFLGSVTSGATNIFEPFENRTSLNLSFLSDWHGHGARKDFHLVRNCFLLHRLTASTSDRHERGESLPALPRIIRKWKISFNESIKIQFGDNKTVHFFDRIGFCIVNRAPGPSARKQIYLHKKQPCWMFLRLLMCSTMFVPERKLIVHASSLLAFAFALLLLLLTNSGERRRKK